MIVALTVPLLYDWMLFFFDWARCKCSFLSGGFSCRQRKLFQFGGWCVVSFLTFFILDSMEWERTAYFAVLFPTALLMSVFFAFFVLDVMWCCVLFADVCILQKGGFSQGLGILFSRSLLSCFFFLFVWKYFISAFPFSSCLSLFSFLFAVFPVLLYCQYAWMVLLFLSDFFLFCSIPSLSTPSFFSILYLYINIDF